MRGRGDFTGFAATAEEGATATDSVAACICPRLRRQYAIELSAFTHGLERSRQSTSYAFSREAASVSASETLNFDPDAV
jgi:hypothetical protein